MTILFISMALVTQFSQMFAAFVKSTNFFLTWQTSPGFVHIILSDVCRICEVNKLFLILQTSAGFGHAILSDVCRICEINKLFPYMANVSRLWSRNSLRCSPHLWNQLFSVYAKRQQALFLIQKIPEWMRSLTLMFAGFASLLGKLTFRKTVSQL